MNTWMQKAGNALRNPRLLLQFACQRLGSCQIMPPVPPRIALSVNSVCNAKCKMCDIGLRNRDGEYYKNIEKGGELDLEVAKRILRDTRRYGPRIAVNGTEPLLYRGLCDLIAYARQSGLWCSVTTNGLLLDKCADDIVQAGLSQLYVSIDGPPGVHDEIRGVSDIFERACAGIRRIQAEKQARGVRHPNIQVAFAVSNLNYRYLLETVTILKEIGVDAFTVSHLNFINQTMADRHNALFADTFCSVSNSCVSQIDPTEVDPEVLVDQIRQSREAFPGFVSCLPEIASPQDAASWYHSVALVLKERCQIAWKNVQVLGNGDVIPSARCFHVVLGNVNTQGILDIWRGPKYAEFRKELRQCGATPACSRCCGLYA